MKCFNFNTLSFHTNKHSLFLVLTPQRHQHRFKSGFQSLIEKQISDWIRKCLTFASNTWGKVRNEKLPPLQMMFTWPKNFQLATEKVRTLFVYKNIAAFCGCVDKTFFFFSFFLPFYFSFMLQGLRVVGRYVSRSSLSLNRSLNGKWRAQLPRKKSK